MDVKIKLIGATFENDEYGVLRRTETVREVFADIQSVTQTEFFEGGRNGLRPQYKITMFAPEYRGEMMIQYGDQKLWVYRTYQPNSDKIELYVQKEAGVQ